MFADEMLGDFLPAHPQLVAGQTEIQKQAMRLLARGFLLGRIDRAGVAHHTALIVAYHHEKPHARRPQQR